MKYAAKYCSAQQGNRITDEHLNQAINDAISNANQSIRDSYQKATIASKTKSKFEDVVAACALVDEDEFGTFAIKDLVEPYYQITGTPTKTTDISYNVNKLCEPGRGSLLTRVGQTKNVRYAFTNPLLKVYIKLKLDERGTFQQPNLFS